MNLTGIFDRARTYIADFKEHERQIARQKLMLEPGKIVLVPEFEKCATVHSDLENGHITYLLSTMSRSVEQAYEEMDESDAPDYYLPESLVPEDLKETISEESLLWMQEEKPLTLAEIRQQLKAEQEKPGGGDPAVIQSLNELVEYIDEFEKPTHYQVMALGDILFAWDEALPRGWFGAELVSKLLGEGQVMVDFYTAVNDLKDYSDLFPDGPSSGHRIKKRERPAEGALKPSWGSLGA